LIIVGEYGFEREWGKGDMNDSQCGWYVIRLGSEAMDDCGVELVCVREVEIEAAAMSEPFGTQGTLVEAACGMKDKGVVLEFAVTCGGEDAVWTVERWQERRHSLVGSDEFCRRIKAAFICSNG